MPPWPIILALIIAAFISTSSITAVKKLYGEKQAELQQTVVVPPKSVVESFIPVDFLGDKGVYVIQLPSGERLAITNYYGTTTSVLLPPKPPTVDKPEKE